MKNLKERCESLCFDLGGPTSMCPSLHRPYVDKLEAFALQIRKEALEEAATHLKNIDQAAGEVANWPKWKVENMRAAFSEQISSNTTALDGGKK